MSRYAPLHASPQGPGDARPTALDIIHHESLINVLHDKTILITGTSSGIGIPTAIALAATGARLFCAVRNLEKGRAALHSVLQKPGARVELVELHLDSLTSVRAAAAYIQSKTKTLNVMINNAGKPPTGRLERTEDGFEAQFGVSYLGHFLLFQLLKPLLVASASPNFGSRVINLTSSGHELFGLRDADDYSFERDGGREYTASKAYSSGKTAMIYMANEIERRYAHRRLHAWSVHPGSIPTKEAGYVDPEIVKVFMEHPEMGKQLKSVEQGAATTVLAAVGKG
ncbi:MAG: hypothetical protein Q9218_007562, partial [Villophora microphyllina]